MDFDFSFFLVVASLITGVLWGGYTLLHKSDPVTEPALDEPWWVDYCRSFFPIIFIVLIIRSFLAEPFRIPSNSMMPTLLTGDFILVNKFTYGIRLPVLNTKVIEFGQPERGDIIVFRYPKQPSIDFIKRVVGLPGDKVAYYNKQVYINGKRVKQVSLGSYTGVGSGNNMTGAKHLIEDLQGTEHSILVARGASSPEGVYVVPDGHYFVMGDNRDHSSDSRVWGMMPEENLVGKAFFIWMNLDWNYKKIDFSRIGTTLK